VGLRACAGSRAGASGVGSGRAYADPGKNRRPCSTARATIRDIAEMLHMSPSAGSLLVDRLVQDGLVERAEDQEDRRRMVLRLSEAGGELVTRLSLVKWHAVGSHVLSRFSIDEIPTNGAPEPVFVHLLRKLSLLLRQTQLD
jgi:DNA-binding MarR family transcriptional regulator